MADRAQRYCSISTILAWAMSALVGLLLVAAVIPPNSLALAGGAETPQERIVASAVEANVLAGGNYATREAAQTNVQVMALGNVSPGADVIMAAPAVASDTTSGGKVCSSSDGVHGSSSLLLPATRWKGATTEFHSRLGSDIWMTVQNKIQRDALFRGAMSFGNTFWAASTDITIQAANFCLLDSVGGLVDSVAARIGQAILDSSLLLFLVVIMVVALLFQGARNGTNPMKQIVSKLAVIALFGVMLFGAQASTGGNALGDDKGAFKPGFGSPGWFAVSTTNALNAVASVPANLVTLDVVENLDAGFLSSDDMQSAFDCRYFVAGLNEAYKDEYKMASKPSINASIPLVLSDMWVTTGLSSWVQAQFGNGNNYGPKVFCFLADKQANIPMSMDGEAAGEGSSTLSRSAFPPSATTQKVWEYVQANDVKGVSKHKLPENVNYGALAFNAVDEATTDIALVGLATCNVTGGYYQIAPGWDGWKEENAWYESEQKKILGIVPIESKKDYPKKEEDLQGECLKLFEGVDDRAKDWNDGGWFDWGDNPSLIHRTIGHDKFIETKDFLLSLHGAKNNAGTITTPIFAVSALSMGLVFIMLALATIIAKVAVIVMMLTVLAILVMTVLPSTETARLGKFVKSFFGVIVFSTFVVLIFSTIAMLSKLLVLSAGTVAEPGSIMMNLWTGAAPLLSVIILHWVFKSVLGLPSPFKLQSALSYGAAAGAMGGAGIAGAGQAGQFLKRTASQALGSRLGGGAGRGSASGAETDAGSGGRAAVSSGDGRKSRFSPENAHAGFKLSGAEEKLAAAQVVGAMRAETLGGKTASAVGSGIITTGKGLGTLGKAIGMDSVAIGSKIADSKAGSWARGALQGIADKGVMIGNKTIPGTNQSLASLGAGTISLGKRAARGVATIWNGAEGQRSLPGRVGHAVASTTAVRRARILAAKAGNSHTGLALRAGARKVGTAAMSGARSAGSAVSSHARTSAALAMQNMKNAPLKTAAGVAGTLALGAATGGVGLAAGAAVMAARSQRDPLARTAHSAQVSAQKARTQRMQQAQQVARESIRAQKTAPLSGHGGDHVASARVRESAQNVSGQRAHVTQPEQEAPSEPVVDKPLTQQVPDMGDPTLNENLRRAMEAGARSTEPLPEPPPEDDYY